MIIFGYDITLSGATVLLAIFTALSAVAATIAACHTKKLAQYTKNLITQGVKQHKEALRPMCVPTTTTDSTITNFSEVLDSETIKLHIVNKGIGPAINVRLHINNINNIRITEDFLVAHALPPGEISKSLSSLNLKGDRRKSKLFTMVPDQVIRDAYFIICEYESIFSGDSFHSIVAKGYTDNYYASDGKNQERNNRSFIPPVKFKSGLDQNAPPVPQNDDSNPGACLNFLVNDEKDHTS